MIDVNFLSGTVNIVGAKTLNVMFVDSNGVQKSFTKSPRIQITLTAVGNSNSYKVADIKNGSLYTGFIIGFGTITTMSIEWQATERA